MVTDQQLFEAGFGISVRIRVWYIYLDEWLIIMVNVGKYTIPGCYRIWTWCPTFIFHLTWRFKIFMGQQKWSQGQKIDLSQFLAHGFIMVRSKWPFPPGFFNPYMVGIGSGNPLLNNMPAKLNAGNKRYFFNIDVRQRSTTHMLHGTGIFTILIKDYHTYQFTHTFKPNVCVNKPYIDSTWRIIPTNKWLVSPPCISHPLSESAPWSISKSATTFAASNPR